MSSRRRRLLVGLALLVAVGLVGAGAVAGLTPWVRIDEETFQRIKRGMSRAEAEALLGGPPGDYATGRVTTIRPFWTDRLFIDLQVWSGDAGKMYVWFDSVGVCDAKFR